MVNGQIITAIRDILTPCARGIMSFIHPEGADMRGKALHSLSPIAINNNFIHSSGQSSIWRYDSVLLLEVAWMMSLSLFLVLCAHITLIPSYTHLHHPSPSLSSSSFLQQYLWNESISQECQLVFEVVIICLVNFVLIITKPVPVFNPCIVKVMHHQVTLRSEGPLRVDRRSVTNGNDR